MLFNKNKYTPCNSKKILHKIKKHWVAISVMLLGLLGGSAITSNNTVKVNADMVNNNSTQENTNDSNDQTSLINGNNISQNSSNQDNTYNDNQANIIQKASQLHKNILNNVAKNCTHTLKLGAESNDVNNNDFNNSDENYSDSSLGTDDSSVSDGLFSDGTSNVDSNSDSVIPSDYNETSSYSDNQPNSDITPSYNSMSDVQSDNIPVSSASSDGFINNSVSDDTSNVDSNSDIPLPNNYVELEDEDSMPESDSSSLIISAIEDAQNNNPESVTLSDIKYLSANGINENNISQASATSSSDGVSDAISGYDNNIEQSYQASVSSSDASEQSQSDLLASLQSNENQLSLANNELQESLQDSTNASIQNSYQQSYQASISSSDASEQSQSDLLASLQSNENQLSNSDLNNVISSNSSNTTSSNYSDDTPSVSFKNTSSLSPSDGYLMRSSDGNIVYPSNQEQIPQSDPMVNNNFNYSPKEIVPVSNGSLSHYYISDNAVIPSDYKTLEQYANLPNSTKPSIVEQALLDIGANRSSDINYINAYHKYFDSDYIGNNGTYNSSSDNTPSNPTDGTLTSNNTSDDDLANTETVPRSDSIGTQQAYDNAPIPNDYMNLEIEDGLPATTKPSVIVKAIKDELYNKDDYLYEGVSDKVPNPDFASDWNYLNNYHLVNDSGYVGNNGKLSDSSYQEPSDPTDGTLIYPNSSSDQSDYPEDGSITEGTTPGEEPNESDPIDDYADGGTLGDSTTSIDNPPDGDDGNVGDYALNWNSFTDSPDSPYDD